MGKGLKADIGKFLKNYGTLANPLNSLAADVDIYDKAPTNTLRLSNKDDINFALWNTLGSLSWLVPAVGISAYLVNRSKHKELKDTINKNTLAHINADYPVLSPEGDLSVTENITGRPRKELDKIREAVKDLPKIASEDPEITTDMITSSVYRSLPLLAMPLGTMLTAYGVNEYLKKKYSDELTEENRKLQNLQDSVDMKTLESLNYIRRKRNKGSQENVKKLADMNTADLMAKLEKKELPKAASEDEDDRSLTDKLTNATKSMFLNIPVATLLLLTGGTTLYGTHWLLKRQNEAKKLKFLKEKALGRNRTLKEPELLVELPEGYEENMDKRQTQIIPGIDSAPVVEDAQIVENPKKDVFLG